MAGRLRVAVLGLADGPEAEAGASVLACLDPLQFERIGIVADRNESGAARPGICDRLLHLLPIEDEGFASALAKATEHEGLEVVLPGSARAAAALAGLSPGPLRRAAFPLTRRNGVKRDGLVDSLAKQKEWPLLWVGEGGDRRVAEDHWEAVRAHQALSASGDEVTRCAFRPEQVFEVALLSGRGGEPLAAAAVRYLATDERLRPWMAVTIENHELQRASIRAARDAKLAGPGRFLFQRGPDGFEGIDACPGFPLWIEVVRAGGPNLVELAVEVALGREPAPPDDLPRTPAGVLFSQTAEDFVVEPPTTRHDD